MNCNNQRMTSQEIILNCWRHAERDVLEVVPCIGGIPLTDLIDQFETNAGMQPAGNAWGGLISQFFRFGPMGDHFHGRSTAAMGPKTPLLGCECGEWGCWPLMATTTSSCGSAAIDQACRMLRLPTIRIQSPELAETAGREQMSYLGFLSELLLAECDDRAAAVPSGESRPPASPATSPCATSISTPTSTSTRLWSNTLATCEWIKMELPLCLIGDSGAGTSHPLIALGTEAAMAGHRVGYVLATKLVNELVEAADDKQLTKTITRYGRVVLLCVDVLGSMELDSRGAELLLQMLTEREEKNSGAIASNESFSKAHMFRRTRARQRRNMTGSGSNADAA